MSSCHSEAPTGGQSGKRSAFSALRPEPSAVLGTRQVFNKHLVRLPVFLLKLVPWDNKTERNLPRLVKHMVQFQNGQFQQGLENVIRGHQVTEHQRWERLPGCDSGPHELLAKRTQAEVSSPFCLIPPVLNGAMNRRHLIGQLCGLRDGFQVLTTLPGT